MVYIRILCVLDLWTDFENVRVALDKVREDYETGTENKVSLSFVTQNSDFTGIPFEDYYGGNYGVSREWIRKFAKERFTMFGDTIDCIMLFIKDKNWTLSGNRNIWGWNLGEFFSGYQIQLIRMKEKEGNLPYDYVNRWNRLTVSMELAHSLDNMADAKGISLENIFGVLDFDEDIVHNQTMWHNGYRDQLRIIADSLVKMFQVRETKLKIIELLGKLVELLRMKLSKVESEPIIRE